MRINRLLNNQEIGNIMYSMLVVALPILFSFLTNTLAASVSGGPNPRGAPIPPFQEYPNAIPQELASLLIEDAKLHASVARKRTDLKFGKLPTTWYPLSGSDAPKARFASEVAIHLLKSIDFPGDLAEQHQIIGAEWWYQVRSNDETIGFHFDKDEAVASLEMRLSHPVMSTVTYLSDIGGPTVVFKQVSVDGNVNDPLVPNEGALFFPEMSKHINFHGNFMHGVVGSLGNKDTKGTRITFLVNWWSVPARPPNCAPLANDLLTQFISKTGKAVSSLSNVATLKPQEPAEIQSISSPSKEVGISQSDFVSISLPPDERLHFWWPKSIKSGSFRVNWKGDAILGGAQTLDLFDGNSVNMVFGTKEPKIFLFYDKDHQDIFELEQIFLASTKDTLGDLLPFIGEKSKTMDAINTFHISPKELPAVAIHDTALDRKFVMTGLFSRTTLDQFIQDFLNGLQNPIG